ncbi:MAG: IS1595 family transposase [Bacteroidaceae bacterium]|nr:IS1595 family transposase [Bacteroidaceae bacterium]
MKTRKVFKGTSLARFNKSFQTDEDCYGYLADIKWKGDSFVCKRCGNTHYCKGHLPFARRCTRCKYDESPTAGTIFDRIRISLLTAFRIVFDMCISPKSMSSSKLAEEYGVRQKTIWEFKRKMQLALDSQDINVLNGMVLVSDFYAMEQDNGKSGIVLIAMEVLDNGEIGKAYGIILDRLSSEHIQRFFEQHISTNAKVYVSKERDYEHLVTNYHMEKNEDTSFLNQSFIHISNLRSWLFGVHRHILPKHIQGYLNEYYFRFNRRDNKALLFDEFIGSMMRNQPNRT